MREFYHDSVGSDSCRQEIILRSPLRETIRGGGSFIVPAVKNMAYIGEKKRYTRPFPPKQVL
jgi:hypothetical protein